MISIIAGVAGFAIGSFLGAGMGYGVVMIFENLFPITKFIEAFFYKKKMAEILLYLILIMFCSAVGSMLPFGNPAWNGIGFFIGMAATVIGGLLKIIE